MGIVSGKPQGNTRPLASESTRPSVPGGHTRTAAGGIDPVMKDPGAAAGRQRVEDAVKAIDDIGRDELPPLAAGKSRVVVEKDIGAEMKGPNLSVDGNLPCTSQARHKMQVIIRLHQSAIDLVGGPHGGLVFCKGRVERGDAIGLVIRKNFFTVIAHSSDRTRQQQQPQTACPNRPAGLKNDYLP